MELHANVEVIFIHGTGAGVPDHVKPRWWQPESTFAKILIEALGSQYKLGEPFLWSGANSETDRRRAGRRLFCRLRQLEAGRRSYALIGHSHGGSVIWHALEESAREKLELTGLIRWVTVGTPFLQFLATPLSLWQLAVALIYSTISIFALAPLWEILIDRAEIWRAIDAGRLSTWSAAASLTPAVAWVAVGTLLWFSCFSRLLARSVPDQIIGARLESWYFSSWLGIWHKDDEPMAALAASSGNPHKLMPRHPLASNEVLAPLFLLYDRIVLSALDELVWLRLMRLLQGAKGATLFVGCACGPWPYPRWWPPLAGEAATSMSKRADEAAARTLSDLRSKLSDAPELGSGTAVIADFTSALTWNELIHTSYFEQSEILHLIKVALLTHNATRLFAKDGHSDATRWLDQGPTLVQPRARAFFTPRWLPVTTAIAFSTIAALSAYVVRSQLDAGVFTYTNRYQLLSIRKAWDDIELVNLPGSAAPGDLAARLAVLGQLSIHDVSLSSIQDTSTRQTAAQKLALLLPSSDNSDTIYKLALRAVARTLPFSSLNPSLPARSVVPALQMLWAVGIVASGDPLKPWIDDFVAWQEQQTQWPPIEIVDRFTAALLRARREDLAKKIVAKIPAQQNGAARSCTETIRSVGRELAMRGDSQALQAASRICYASDISTEAKRDWLVVALEHRQVSLTASLFSALAPSQRQFGDVHDIELAIVLSEAGFLEHAKTVAASALQQRGNSASNLSRAATAFRRAGMADWAQHYESKAAETALAEVGQQTTLLARLDAIDAALSHLASAGRKGELDIVLNALKSDGERNEDELRPFLSFARGKALRLRGEGPQSLEELNSAIDRLGWLRRGPERSQLALKCLSEAVTWEPIDPRIVSKATDQALEMMLGEPTLPTRARLIGEIGSTLVRAGRLREARLMFERTRNADLILRGYSEILVAISKYAMPVPRKASDVLFEIERIGIAFQM
jgi:tetratricopeptide (TPR) repeat protein